MAIYNPFKHTDAPDHMIQERKKRLKHIRQTLWLCLAAGVTGFAFTPLIVYFFVNGQPFSTSTLSHIWQYVLITFSSRYAEPHLYMLNMRDYIPFSLGMLPNSNDPYLKGVTAYTFVTTISVALAALRHLTNPHRKMVFTADASWCDEKTLLQMEERRQVGIKGGFLGTLGIWPDGIRKGQHVKMIETLSALCLAPPGTGKCLAPHERVLMHDGTVKRNADLKVGDLLMGPDGKPRRVLKTNTGYGPMYRIIPNKGRAWECNGDHILSLRCSKKPRNRSIAPKQDEIKHVTVEDWIGASREQRAKWKQWRAAVDFPSRAEPAIDPYFIGLFLGDGSSVERVGIHTADNEIAAYAAAVAESHGLRIRECRQEGNASTFYAMTAGNGGPRKGKNPIVSAIEAYGLHVTCHDKFIPHELKVGSRDTRLAVLAGIIDSDGYYDPAGKGYDLTLASAKLADDIAFIARSLGLAAYPRACEKTCANNGVKGTYHRVFISGDVSMIPVKLFRRQAQPRAGQKDVTNVGFKIEPIGLGPWFGIVLDGDHQFLLDDFTVTHNTAGFVVPTLITCPGSTFIVNDSKPELFEMTGGARAKISNVFMLDWSKVDDPENDVYYPRFNFLSPKLVPPAGPNRDTFVDSIAKTLIPDKKGGGDSYFTDKGRGALTGFIHLLIAKVNDARDYDGIPEAWVGQEASLPMLVDWMAAAQYAASTGGGAADDGFVGDPDEREPASQSQDPMGDWIKSLSAVVNPASKGPAASPRAFTELSPLIMMADKERSGVLGTMDQALIPFKNEAVKQRTSACDFTPADLRGIWDPKRPNPSRPKSKQHPEGDHWWPVTLYICVNQAEADAFATITALLYEVMSRYLLSFGANEYDPKSKKTMGPFPICFMLDEFAKLPRIEAVIQGPDLGRSKQLSYWFLAQAYGQIEKKYEKSDIGVINSTTAVKIILSQNDNDTADMIAKMVGDTTIRKASHSYQDGLSKSAFSWSRNDTVEKVPFLRHADIIGMQPGTHLVLVQNFMNRPMKLNTPMYFKDPDMAPLVRARGKGPVADTILPGFAKRARKKAYKKSKNSQIIKNFELASEVQKIGTIDLAELP